MKYFFLFVLLFNILAGCSQTKKDDKAKASILEFNTCIETIIITDDSLGKIRNYACETVSLNKSIENYVNGLSTLEFESCPQDFKDAFTRHITAWLEIMPVLEPYADLRGEMHILFDQIDAGPDSIKFRLDLAKIWSTWAEVETAINKHSNDD